MDLKYLLFSGIGGTENHFAEKPLAELGGNPPPRNLNGSLRNHRDISLNLYVVPVRGGQKLGEEEGNVSNQLIDK